jgi:hypothetical protein
MGADLYIMKLPHEAQITGFRTDIEVGYFRDSYNDSNLLWKFGLSYWNDIPKMSKETDEGTQLQPEGAKRLLRRLKNRETRFDKAIQEVGLAKDETREEVVKYFKDRYEEFKKFLNKAIELGSPIDCSV